MNTTQTAGMVTKNEVCSRHNIEYARILVFSDPDTWVGECPTCKEDGELERRAIERAYQRRDEILRQVGERVEKLKKQIAKETEAEIEKYLNETRAEVGPQFADYVRGLHWERVRLAVEAEFKAEELAKLREGA